MLGRHLTSLPEVALHRWVVVVACEGTRARHDTAWFENK